MKIIKKNNSLWIQGRCSAGTHWHYHPDYENTETLLDLLINTHYTELPKYPLAYLSNPTSPLGPPRHSVVQQPKGLSLDQQAHQGSAPDPQPASNLTHQSLGRIYSYHACLDPTFSLNHSPLLPHYLLALHSKDVYSHCLCFSSSFILNTFQSGHLSNLSGITAFAEVSTEPSLCQIQKSVLSLHLI